MAYSLVASDYDLTLAALPEARMTSRVVDTLQELQRSGVPLAVASGRGPAGIRHNLERHNLDLSGIYLCGYNGAEIIEGGSERHIFCSRLPGDLSRDIFRAVHAFPVEIMAHANGTVYSAHPESFHAQVDARSNGIPLLPIDDDGVARLRPAKFLVAGEAEELQRVAQFLRAEFAESTEVVFSADFLLEVNAAGTDKGAGLRALAAALEIPIEETIGFGDNFNDIPLITTAGLGVAMGNAVPELRAVADRIAPSCYDDGFSQMIDELM